MKNDVPQGAQLGEEAHTLITAEMPEHIHSLSGATDTGGLASPLAAGKMLPTSNNAGANVYAAPANLTTLHPASISSVGGGQPHENMQPYLTLNFVIALMGIFPSRN